MLANQINVFALADTSTSASVNATQEVTSSPPPSPSPINKVSSTPTVEPILMLL